MRIRMGCPRARKNSALKVPRSGSDRHVTSDILLYYCLCMSMQGCSHAPGVHMADATVSPG
jgi:hypothetical protein